MRNEKDELEYQRQKKIASDFQWCIDNDFQIYTYPDNFDSEGVGKPPFRIHVRRKGITTEGKDSITTPDGVEVKSNVLIGPKEYKTMAEASKAMEEVYAMYRKKYG